MPTPEQYANALQSPGPMGFVKYLLNGKRLPNEMPKQQPNALQQYGNGNAGYHQYAANMMEQGLTPVSMQEWAKQQR